MSPEILESPDALRAIAGEWDDLVARTQGGEIFARFAWLDAWWRAFASEGSLSVHCVRHRGRLVAALPLQRVPIPLDVPDPSVLPAPLLLRRAAAPLIDAARGPWAAFAGERRLRTLFNHYAGRSVLLADPAEPEALPTLLRALAAAADRWDVIELPWLPEDVPLFALLRDRCPPELNALAHRTSESPYLELSGEPFADYYARRFSAKTRSRDRQSLRHAAERPGFALEVVRGESLGGAERSRLLDEVMAVEALGWKGARGSSMSHDPRTRRFVTDVVTELAPDGHVRFVLLRLDGRLAAFVLAFVFEGTYSYYKTSFDPAFDDLRPGRIVTTHCLEDAFNSGASRFDFLGAAEEYKLRYTDQVRPHATTFLYHRGVRSQLHRAVKRTAVPLAKRLLGGRELYPVRLDR